MTGPPAASSAVLKTAPTLLRTQPIASATQMQPATPVKVPTTQNALHSKSKIPPLRQHQKTRKTPIQPPPNLFRLERTSILCFHTLNPNFNRTHVSVRNLNERYDRRRGIDAGRHGIFPSNAQVRSDADEARVFNPKISLRRNKSVSNARRCMDALRLSIN
jgi:hypothetical protein